MCLLLVFIHSRCNRRKQSKGAPMPIEGWVKPHLNFSVLPWRCRNPTGREPAREEMLVWFHDRYYSCVWTLKSILFSVCTTASISFSFHWWGNPSFATLWLFPVWGRKKKPQLFWLPSLPRYLQVETETPNTESEWDPNLAKLWLC